MTDYKDLIERLTEMGHRSRKAIQSRTGEVRSLLFDASDALRMQQEEIANLELKIDYYGEIIVQNLKSPNDNNTQTTSP
ncbi:MAG: hypothetical protein GY941_27340 [Planctomycetes bacterium]|nr:hypothetical protein [Planctomycetota bacterium]